MKIGDIFTIEQYDEAFNFISKNEGTTIQEVESKLEDVTKTKQVEKTDKDGNAYFEEETYTEKELVKYYQIVELPKPSLDELKEAKQAEINQARDKSEQGGFEYMGKVFDSDQVSCQRISIAAQAMANASDDATITWTCQDNTTVDLNKTQLAELVAALATWSNTCHEKATALKSQIEAAKTTEELEKITWDSKTKLAYQKR